jgi:hypothetical protein
MKVCTELSSPPPSPLPSLLLPSPQLVAVQEAAKERATRQRNAAHRKELERQRALLNVDDAMSEAEKALNREKIAQALKLIPV